MPVNKELCVAVRKYQDKEGKDKTEWLNIGRIIEKEDGRKFMILKPWVNLSAIPREGSDVMVSMFDPKPNDYQQNQSSSSKSSARDYAKASTGGSVVSDDFSDDIPF